MKRRNAECGKLRRPVKRSKITEGLYGSTFLYLKFLLVWSLVLIADFILEFRFEYLWPFWLLVRSVYDSFKYQGLAFSVFFVCIAITSDVVCYLYVPVQWLFFAASTYVWVQYVWHTERGICLPTVSLWLLFVYIEASVRLRELKSLPFNLDLCRPFAAHCIGYPVVTLGFGFKSYVTYRIRLRKQKEVQKENEFYVQLLNQALPQELQNAYTEKLKALVTKSEDETVVNGSAGKRPFKSADDKKVVDDDDDEQDYIEQPAPTSKKSNVNENYNDETADNIVNDQKSLKVVNGVVANKSNKLNSNKENNTKKGKNYSKDISSVVALSNTRDDAIFRLETDMKKLRAELQTSRNCEQDLRSQINTQTMSEKALKSELYQVQQDNENLQNKLHNLVTSRQSDKQNLAIIERKLQEERKTRAAVEQQLSQERKAKKAEEAAAARAIAMAVATKNDCSETCKTRRRDAELDQKQLRRDLKIKDDQVRQFERELKNMASQKDLSSETEVLMSALSAMQDKNTHLECSLSSETRIKLDLFSALGDAKRHLEIQQAVVTKKENEIASLKKKIAEVMALVPCNTYNGLTSSHTPPPTSSSPLYCSPASSIPYSPLPCSSSPLYSTSPELLVASNLNPNACDYLPKTTA